MGWSAAIVTTPPAAPALALAAVKQFVRVDDDVGDYDTQLTAFAAAAAAQVEAVCGVRLVPQSLDIAADDWCDLAALPVGPVTAIGAIHWQDGNGIEQLLDAAIYELAGAGLATSIRLTAGSNWPSGLRRVAGAIRVSVVAGYAELPPPLWAAALYLTGDLFAFRESAVVGTVSSKVPMSATVEALLANYRIWLA